MLRFVNSRALSPAQNDRVRELLQEQLAKHKGNMSALARALGVSRPFVFEVIEGNRGAGISLIEGLAKITGIPAAELLGYRDERDDGEGTEWARLEGWGAASAAVLEEHPYLAPYVRRAGRLRGARPPEVSSAFVLRQALTFYESTPLAERARIAHEATSKAIAAHVKETERRAKGAKPSGAALPLDDE